MNIHALIPTRGDRKSFVEFAVAQMQRQTRVPDVIEVVDYQPASPAVDIASRFKFGIEKCFRAGADVVFFIEDDDFYSEKYIESMIKYWFHAEKPALFGIDSTVYYHLGLRMYAPIKHPGRASMYNTMISEDFDMSIWPEDPERYVDVAVWDKAVDKKTVSIPEPISLGIKHGHRNGLTGGSMHNPDRFLASSPKSKVADPDLNFLRHFTGVGFEFYEKIIAKNAKRQPASPKVAGISIISARYYTDDYSMDVTDALRLKLTQSGLDVMVNNKIAGDPHIGMPKKLYLKYSLNGRAQEMTAVEGEKVILLPVAATKTVKPNVDLTPLKKPDFTDIIIPTYLNEKLTIDCFESIKQHTAPGSYRIIWVDNGSPNKKIAARSLEDVPHITVAFTENKGFVDAINEGLRISDAPTVCLLNNDTEVSANWMEKLTNTLYSDPAYGIIGPLTGPPAFKQRYDSQHNVTYQQVKREVPVFPYYKNLEDFNQRIESQFPGLVAYEDFVAFLCAVIKREVIDKVGFLDTNYDMGMWDDCDWNQSAKHAGYKVGLALDTCIIHKGRSTFKIIQKKEGFDVDALLAKNRKYLDQKWAGKWV